MTSDTEIEDEADAHMKLRDPRKNHGQLMPIGFTEDVAALKAKSEVWKKLPQDWSCLVCGGKGHIENSCATKRALDNFSKKLPDIERKYWGEIKFKLYY